jgi:pimeloyl-ACP methyl ester carboxylesterase
MLRKINGAWINVLENGNPQALPVVFVHGFPFSHAMWHRQLQVVSSEFRAIAYDVRGMGESSVGDGQYTIEEHVDDLIALLDDMGIASAVVVGLSMGGYIALRALERNLPRFRAAILCDTRSEADSNEERLGRALAVAEVKRRGAPAFADDFVKKIFANGSLARIPDEISLIHGIISRTTPIAIAGTLLALAARTDTTASLGKLNIPTLILVGDQDITTPPEASRSMHQKIPGSTLRIIPDAAHMSPLENPEAVNGAMMAFLRALKTP